MKPFALLSAATVIGFAIAQDIDTGDYPAACQNYCGPVAVRSSSCQANTDDNNDEDDDDSSELRCICNGSGMSTAVPRCDACVAPFRIQGDDDYSDISELLSACGFSTTSLASAPTPTTTYVFTTTSTDDDGDQEVETITSFGAPLPSGLSPITSVVTTTSTDDDGEVETDVDTTTIYNGAASASSTVITTTSNGETLTQTKIASPTGATAGSGDSSSTSPNVAVRTAAPIIGAAAIAVGALAAL